MLSKYFIYQLKYKSPIPNSVTDKHQPGPDNICGHTSELTTTMYFNQWFWLF